jgi:capreomycidine synthase
MRLYYFNAGLDIGSSGVESFALREVREIVGLSSDELDRVTFSDSWTQGATGLREAIARRWQVNDPQHVMATHGSSESIYLVMNALLKPGDEVIALAPCYQQLATIAESIGCHLKPWRLRFEDQFVPDVEELRSLISQQTKMVVVNFPHNPTGASLTLAQQKELIDAVAGTGAYLFWDAAFAELTYDRAPLPIPNHYYDRSISIGTLSKSYGLPGLRVGWCVASPDALNRCVNLRDYMTLHLSPLVELIAQRAIENSDRLINIRLRQARTNLDILTEWVERHREVVEWARPRGGVCAFPRLPCVPDVERLCHRLAQQHGVLLVPGGCFNYPRHVRLGFGGSTVNFKQALTHFSCLLKSDR